MNTVLTEIIARLADFEPVPYPVLSLYLNAQPDSVGRDSFDVFLRKAFAERLKTYAAHAPERESLEQDVERIRQYLAETLRPSANGVAIFACAGADGFFEAVQLDAPVDEHRLYIADRPHLYPLARLDERFPRYAAVLADTNMARIFVFGMNRLEREEQVVGQKTKRLKVGGWSQARFQRHIENYHLQHVKEVIDTLDRIVREESIPHILLAGDEVVLPLIREQLPQSLEAKVLDTLRLDINAPEREVLDATLAALRHKGGDTEAELVGRLLDEVRGGGLGVIGADATLEALQRGQVDELLILAQADLLLNVDHVAPVPAGESDEATPAERAANHLVTLARQTAASVRFIEDPLLLAEVGGVGALLRFRL
jgi:peptide chain release factor subunit 1